MEITDGLTSERPTEQRRQDADVRGSRRERNEAHCRHDHAHRGTENAEAESDEYEASDKAQRAAGTTSQERSYRAPCECHGSRLLWERQSIESSRRG